MNNEWCEGKHPPTMNKVYTKEKPLRLLNSKEFSKFMLPNYGITLPIWAMLPIRAIRPDCLDWSRDK